MAIITLSRGTYGGVKALAQDLSQTLGYRLLSREELLAEAAQEFGASQSQLESALKYRPGFLEGRGMKKLHYVYCIRALLARAVQGDNIVYHGQAGNVLLEGVQHHLRVRVVANMGYRIQAVMEQCEFTREKAIEYLGELDKERDNWVRWVYGVEADDPHGYDVVVNLERIPAESAIAIIAETAQRDFQTTAESQRALDDLVLASEARAKIGLDKGISDDRIEIEAHDGVVTITANVRSLPHEDRIRELLGQLPGLRDIQSKIATNSH
jgi:cytidylate kinase